MGDILKAIEFLGIPTTIAISMIILLLILQFIGEIIEFFGKAVPEFFKIRKYFSRKKKEKEETKQALLECQRVLGEFSKYYCDDNIAKRNQWMDSVNNSVQTNDTLIHKLDAKLDKLLDDNENFKTQLDQVKHNVLDNEADRLRSELFDCGNRCRRNIRLHPEEWEHIKVVFNKYSNVLKQNGSGEAEFNFIRDYYNHQNFPTYHQPNN